PFALDSLLRVDLCPLYRLLWLVASAVNSAAHIGRGLVGRRKFRRHRHDCVFLEDAHRSHPQDRHGAARSGVVFAWFLVATWGGECVRLCSDGEHSRISIPVQPGSGSGCWSDAVRYGDRPAISKKGGPQSHPAKGAPDGSPRGLSLHGSDWGSATHS